MRTTPILALLTTLLQIAVALPQLVLPSQDTHADASCREMEADLSSCFQGTPYLLNDLELDEAAMKKCVCSKESFTAGIVTFCTGDPKTYEDLCGDDGDADPDV